MDANRANPMTMLSETKLVFLDVETTGLSPAMGDRVIEVGMIACQGTTEISRSSHLINPGRPIPPEAQRVHGISDQDVSDSPPFKEFAEEIESILVDSWVVGHNVRFDIGFMAMELQQTGCSATPLGCLDTCQLASALWEFRNYETDRLILTTCLPPHQPHFAVKLNPLTFPGDGGKLDAASSCGELSSSVRPHS